VPSTFTNAINEGTLPTWPGLTADLIVNILPTVQCHKVVKGHIKQEFKNIRSTKKYSNPRDDLRHLNATTTDIPGERVHECYVTIATKEAGTTY
jgi:hypothetical protein